MSAPRPTTPSVAGALRTPSASSGLVEDVFTRTTADGTRSVPATAWQSLGKSVLAVICFAFVLAAPAAAQQPAREISIYDVARYGVAQKRIQRTEMVGFTVVKTPYLDMPRPAGVLVGFDVGLGPFNDELAIYALRPIFQNAKQTAASKSFGLFQNEKRNNIELKTKVTQIVRLLAKPGYAVGEVTLDRGLFLQGMSLRYMKIAGPALDTNDAYSSQWVGSATGENRATLSGGGSPFVGIHGNLDRDVRGLGLVYLDPSVYQGLNLEKPVAAKAGEAKPANPAPIAVEAPGALPAESTPLADETSLAAAHSPEETNDSSAQHYITGIVFIGVTCVVLATLYFAFGRKSATPSAASTVLAAGKSRVSTGSATVPPIVPAMLGVAMQYQVQNPVQSSFASASYPVTAEVVDAVLVK